MTALLLGCARATAPVVPPEPPAPDPPPNPGNALFVCGKWSPQAPTVELAAFDLLVVGDAPIEEIRRAGGTVLHAYQVPLVRALVPVDAIPRLGSGLHIVHAQEVSVDGPLAFRGSVGFVGAATDADVELLRQLGVTDMRVGYRGLYVEGDIPDAAVGAIRDHERVRWVEAKSYACLAGVADPQR